MAHKEISEGSNIRVYDGTLLDSRLLSAELLIVIYDREHRLLPGVGAEAAAVHHAGGDNTTTHAVVGVVADVGESPVGNLAGGKTFAGTVLQDGVERTAGNLPLHALTRTCGVMTTAIAERATDVIEAN